MVRLILLAALPTLLVASPQSDDAVRPEPVFRDNFESDTQAAYDARGDVSWERGRLTLAEGASVERVVDGGAWAIMTWGCEFPVLTADRPRSELALWLILEGTTNCYVRLRREQTTNGPVTSLTLVDTWQQAGKPIEQVVRGADIDDVAAGTVTVEYRYGLVRVTVADQPPLVAYIQNGTATVQATQMQSRSGDVSLTLLEARAIQPGTETVSELQQQQLADAAARAGEVLRLYGQGKFDAAVAIGEDVLKVRRTLLGDRHPDTATSLNNLATLFEETGDYARAESLHQEALEIRRAVVGKQHPDYATSLNNLAMLYYSMGDYSRAEPLYIEAIDIDRSVQGEQHPGYATSLNNIALLYESMGDYARAEPLYRQAAEILRAALGEQHRDYASNVNNLALLYYRMGDYARAKPLFEQALAIRKSVLGEQHRDYTTSLNSLALLLETTREYVRAEPLYQQAMEIKKSVLGEQHPSYAVSLNNLAGLYENMGDHARAEPLYRQAATVLSTALGERHPGYATSLNNLASLYDRTGQHRQAEPLYRQASDIWKLVLGDQHPDYATSLSNLAGVYRNLGDEGRAALLSSKAVEIVRDNLDRNSLVQSERQQKRNQTIHRHFLDGRLSLSPQSAEDTEDVVRMLWEWKGAVTARQRAYRRVAADKKLSGLFAQLQAVARQLSASMRRVPIPPAPAATAVQQEEFRLKREAWDQRLASLVRQREDLEQRIAAASEEFRRIREPLVVAQLQSLLPERTAFVDFLEYGHEVPASQHKQDLIRERHYLAIVVRPDREPAMIRLGSAETLGRAVHSFREPFSDDARSHAVSGRGQKLREMLWQPVERHLDGIQTVVISPDTILGALPFAALPGAQPGTYLIEQYRFASVPLAGMLRSLFDDGESVSSTEKGLLVLGDVAYDASPNAKARSEKEGGRPAWMRRSGLYAGGADWQSLPGFENELVLVRDRFQKAFGDSVTTLRGARATEAEFIAQAPRHYNLHVITHGFFAGTEFSGKTSPESAGSGPRGQSGSGASETVNQYMPGLLSGLVLAGANNPPTADAPHADGILTATEIETLDLNSVNLVVLSACETGLGKSAGGEGLTGLQRAFHIAGARSCIATLWKVPDKATQELMTRFYRYYWQDGRSRIDSLRQAQLDILNDQELARGLGGVVGSDTDARPQRSDPRYWAAFVLSGDWR